MLNILNNKYVKLGIKVAICVWINIFVIQIFCVEGFSKYYSFKDYDYTIDNFIEKIYIVDNETEIHQEFISKGNILNNILIYIDEVKDKKVEIIIEDNSGNDIYSTVINLNEYRGDAWNRIAIDCNVLHINEEYTVKMSSENGLSGVRFGQSDNSEVYGACSVDGKIIDGVAAIGFEFTYEYMAVASVFELLVVVLTSAIMVLGLCYSVMNIEKLYKMFNESKVKRGLWCSLYFSISFVLLYNPLDRLRNQVVEFKRVIGVGISENVDVTRRVSNFNTWFIMFALSFCLLYLLINYLFQKKIENDNKKMMDFIDNIIVLANCLLVFKIITYFYNDAYYDNLYVFSNEIVLVIILTLFSYIVFDLQKNISLDEFAKLLIVGVAVSYVLTIFGGMVGNMDKVLVGVLGIVLIAIILFCKFCRAVVNTKNYKYISNGGVVILVTLPLMTSVYIELIHILNQYSIFVAHPVKYYVVANILVGVVYVCCVIFFIKKKIVINNWKKWSYPILIVGIACLSIQIPLQSTYNLDVFEGANYSVLISDFFNYGSIPLVEHYGGHMMTGVWEGILYGIVNNDHAGAIVSPYSNLLVVLLALLFYYFIRTIWDENVALIVTLCFPYFDYWSYYGLGMMVCLAIARYIKKRTYSRALFIWLAFIWCALYRLDLGFAFGAATIISLIIYIVSTKCWEAIKQLGITLFGCAGIGITIWTMMCVIKGINPITRLYEFIMLSLSNQNWAYASIGNSAHTVFGAYYVVLPFSVMVCLLYAIFSKKIRENIDESQRIILITIGISFFVNFSRGLVRHSLVEMFTKIIIWTGFVFLAYFFSSYKKNKKVFLPIFMMFMMLDTLFVQDNNFTSKSIMENSVVYPQPIIQSWTEKRSSDKGLITYWEEIKIEGNVVERVRLSEHLNKMKYQYKTVLDKLLNEDETFIDYANKTIIYSLLEKKDPVYVSQSPLQISGEFTQKQFIEQIEDVPVIIMPINPNDYGVSISLDGISNVYRNYLISEHMYRDYMPLCKYGDVYAIWCLKNRYDEYKAKLAELLLKNEHIDMMLLGNGIEIYNAKMVENSDGTVMIIANGLDPMITEIQNLFDITSYVNGEMVLEIEYTTDVAGDLQLFYTERKGEEYSGNRVQTVKVSNTGVAQFTIPITEYTKLRLDIPEGANFIISSLSTKTMVEEIAYGYDGPFESNDVNGNTTYEYISGLHSYYLNQLPRIWMMQDEEGFEDVVINMVYNEGVYSFDNGVIELDEESYLKITATYNGVDSIGLHTQEDESIWVTVVLGNYYANKFDEKCRYTINMKEGTYDYYIRVSADYYWYIGDINSIKVQNKEDLFDMQLQIIQ